ncbi:Rrf2 family transcriptional regulator [Paenibacillus sp. FSL R10-2782]|uniref:Rrf2 family transcriptional regulator n=1 Tax=Paenibacillus sp. FSL R10-2782 TaxID=2954661 RepID=UPI0031592306
MLKKARLVEVRPGVGGAYLKKEASQITLLDVYLAVDLVEDNQLFHFHKPKSECEIGQLMENVLRQELAVAQNALEQQMQRTTIQDLLNKLR